MIKKNTAITGFFIGNFIKTSDGSVATSGSPTGKRSLDGVKSDMGNLPTYSASAGGWSIPTLTAGDTNGNFVGLNFALTDYQPISIAFPTETKKMADLQDLAAGAAMTLSAASILSATLAASAVTKIQLGLATTANVQTDTVVDGKSIPAALKVIAATTAGKISGAGTGTETFVGLDGATTRATVTVDVDGNRSAVSYP